MTGALRAMTLAAALALVRACREHAHEPSREQTHEHHAAPSIHGACLHGVGNLTKAIFDSL